MLKGGRGVQLGDFCMNVGAFCPKITSHEQFIDELFTAAGSMLYISVSYKRKLYTGNKLFTDKLKNDHSLRGRNNYQMLKDFFLSNIPDDKVLDVLLKFGVPEKGEPNKAALCGALALQLRAIIDGNDNGADDIMATSYQEQKNTGVIEKDQGLFQPIYPGDSAYVSSGSRYEIGVHDTVLHTWVIQNTGKVKWENRKLVYIRGPKDRPEATPSEIPIPDVGPGESIKITTTFDGRGFDGVFHCFWEMQDSDGENCFPKRDSLFSVTIDAKFKRT